MPTEKILVKTKDNCVIAFDITYQNSAERARLALECENMCKDVIYRGRRNNFTYSSAIDLDQRNTEFLNKEIAAKTAHTFPTVCVTTRRQMRRIHYICHTV